MALQAASTRKLLRFLTTGQGRPAAARRAAPIARVAGAVSSAAPHARGPNFFRRAAEIEGMPAIPRTHRLGAAVVTLVAAAAPGRADISISLYGDVDGGIATTGKREGTTDGFSAAKLELFTTAHSGNWAFLAETLFEAGDDNEFGVDVERLQINYLYRDWLRVAIGRFHTAVGYYNDGFHHGAFFMPATARPQIVQFEDDGGVIPAHSVGVHIDGRLPPGESPLRYDIDLGNGRASNREIGQVEHDTNRPKSFNVRLRYEPAGAA